MKKHMIHSIQTLELNYLTNTERIRYKTPLQKIVYKALDRCHKGFVVSEERNKGLRVMSQFGNEGKLSVSIRKGIQLLKELEKESKKLIKNEKVTHADFSGYRILLKGYAKKIFEENSSELVKLSCCDIDAEETIFRTEGDLRLERIQEKIEHIKSLRKVLQLDLDKSSKENKKEQSLGESIFIVHGHDIEILKRVKKVLKTLRLKHKVLHEQSNEGRTLIEKFEDTAEDIGFAIVIMTGDDKGGSKKDDFSKYKNRARQNVILELGFFLGKIGRERVCVLLEEGVEKPSDYEGVVYIPLEDDAQLLTKLTRELKAVGFKIGE